MITYLMWLIIFTKPLFRSIHTFISLHTFMYTLRDTENGIPTVCRKGERADPSLSFSLFIFLSKQHFADTGI